MLSSAAILREGSHWCQSQTSGGLLCLPPLEFKGRVGAAPNGFMPHTTVQTCTYVGGHVVQGCTQSNPTSRYNDRTSAKYPTVSPCHVSHHLYSRLSPCLGLSLKARASPTLVERTKTPYLPSRVKPFLRDVGYLDTTLLYRPLRTPVIRLGSGA